MIRERALGVVGVRKPHEATHTKEESWSSVRSRNGAKRLRRTGRNLRWVSKNTNENNEHDKEKEIPLPRAELRGRSFRNSSGPGPTRQQI